MFCDIIRGDAPATFVEQWREAIAIVPLNPVTQGHVLVIPRQHVDDAAEDVTTTMITMRYAALVARLMKPCNIITSVGAEATQTVFHLHIHVVPRRAGDGLLLPWSDQ